MHTNAITLDHVPAIQMPRNHIHSVAEVFPVYKIVHSTKHAYM